MTQYVGKFVKTTAGHDKGGLFFVLDYREDRLYLANGRQRRLEKPKKKKLQHVSFLETWLQIPLPHSNKALRRAIVALEKEGTNLGER